LKPARKRLATVDAERIITVVDMTIQKLELLSVMSSARFKDLELQVQSGHFTFPAPVAAALVDHREAEVQYKSATNNGRNTAALQKTTRTLLRELLRHEGVMPDIMAAAKAVQDADEGLGLTLSKMRQLRALLFEKLLTTVDEERKRQGYLAGLIAREEEAKERIRKLEDEVQQLEDDRNTEVEKRESVIQRVLEDLQAITHQGKFVQDRVNRGAESRIKKDSESAGAKKKELLVDVYGWKPGKDDDKEAKEIRGLKDVLEDLRVENRAREAVMRKEKQKTEHHIDGVIAEYDRSMKEKQDEIDSINALYEDEKLQLSELEARLATIKTEYDVIMEERKRERDRREKAADELAKMVKAALLMQKFWRAYKARKALKKAGSKKSKKKKK